MNCSECHSLRMQLDHVEEILNNIVENRPESGSEKSFMFGAHVLLRRIGYWKEHPNQVISLDGSLVIGVPEKQQSIEERAKSRW